MRVSVRVDVFVFVRVRVCVHVYACFCNFSHMQVFVEIFACTVIMHICIQVGLLDAASGQQGSNICGPPNLYVYVGPHFHTCGPPHTYMEPHILCLTAKYMWAPTYVCIFGPQLLYMWASTYIFGAPHLVSYSQI